MGPLFFLNNGNLYVSKKLVDFKLEFGRSNNEIILADEISPDNCRLWDKKSKLSLDKDLFRQDKGDLINAYEYIHTKLNRKLNV